MRRVVFVLAWGVTLALTAVLPTRLVAGAFPIPQGQGQIIAGVGYIEAPRTFDRSGRPLPTAAFRKAEADAYIEYGLTDWLTLVATPTAARMHAGALSGTFTGSDESALGARVLLHRSADQAISVQALVQPPTHVGYAGSEPVLGGPRTAAIDVRFQLGRTFSILGHPAFIDLEPGGRYRGGGFATEARFDATFGVRLQPRLMVLVQDFVSVAGRSGAMLPSAAYSKAAASLVYDLSRAWSLQAGGVRTLAGRNVGRETGPFAALWYRF